MWDLSEHLGEGVRALVTDHDQDFSLPEDMEDPFNEKQHVMLSESGIDPDRIFTIRQVHEATVLNMTDGCLKINKKIPKADGLVTNLKNITLSVRTADCIPVFLYDPVCRCIGLVHAGWKSTQQEIVGTALKEMSRNFKSCPADLKVVFGPSIRSCCYQVSQDFCEIFPEHMVPRQGDWFLDLIGVNIRQLESFGVRRENIDDVEWCTCCNDRFFSYRRDGKKAGRHLSLLRIMP